MPVTQSQIEAMKDTVLTLHALRPRGPDVEWERGKLTEIYWYLDGLMAG